MTKKRSAKNAFISSLVMLCLCVTMLVGTTFAWYTDSVTSGRNTIVAGSLDMTLQYYTGTDGDFTKDANWTKVTSTTPVFSDSTSFEPGATQVAYVRVKNTGDLAFKYKLTIAVDSETIGKNKAGADLKLSDILYYGTEEFAAQGHAPYATRDAAINAVKENKAKIASALLKEYQIVEAGKTSDVIAIVIYMPAETGNDANPDPAHKPSITFGLNALATQYAKESDSFNNQYDANAEYPAPAEASQTVTAATPTDLEVEAGAFSVTVPAAAQTQGDVYTVKASDVVTNTTSAGDATVSFDLSLYKNGTKVETATNNVSYPVEINVGTGRVITKVMHGDDEITNYTYNPATGILSFEVAHFSPFAITYKAGERIVSTAEELDTAIADPSVTKITLNADIVIDKTMNVRDKVLTLDMNGKTISNTTDIWDDDTGDYSLLCALSNADVTIKGDGKFLAKENDCYAIDIWHGSTVTIENGTFVGNIHAIYVGEGNLIVNGGDFSVLQKYSATQPYDFVLNCLDANYNNGTASYVVYGGTFHG
ncbi:MAG: SipW-dependent-type signal peptide-containing protein, partial [Clostridia bacterium]|nr:SipW-dependent-type signal peptide-containing protein [Clostridia bacterium]